MSAFDAAVKLLSGRDKSRAQLVAALVLKGHTAEEIRDAIERCAALHYLDDDRAAIDLATKLYGEHRSAADVARRLEAKGFDPTVAERIPHDDLAAADQLLKSRGLGGVKAARLLGSRGFDDSVVTSLVDVPEGGE